MQEGCNQGDEHIEQKDEPAPADPTSLPGDGHDRSIATPRSEGPPRNPAPGLSRAASRL